MDLQLRPATIADHPFLQRLNREAYEELVTRQYGAWDDEFQRARFGKKLQSARFRIVLLDDQPVGAVASTEHDDHIFLNELLILPEFQNRGIGSRVLVGELRHADLLGKPMRLHTLQMNRAQELYRRHGFIETGRDELYVNMQRGG
ncbi:MAG TPA: GNAT family N-acetyltransferase [Candidatus Methylomirabilis sp.]|nr:GNAT family N-acetyltransferase [Candidatus Methylomirabilis sp.]